MRGAKSGERGAGGSAECRAPVAVAPAPASLRAPGAILLVSCYELGHQPLGTAWAAAFLERAGFAPDQLDLAVDPLDEERVRRARVVALSVPMHTALRVGVAAARRIRAVNPDARLVFYGLYAVLNAEYLRHECADAILGGEMEQALVTLIQDWDEVVQCGMRNAERGMDAPGSIPHSAFDIPHSSVTGTLARLQFPVPSRTRLRPVACYAALERDGRRVPAGAVEASRGCLHKCRHCPIPPVYGGRFFVVPPEVVLADVRQQVARGARHITFADPDFLNGPGHALRVTRALHAEFPAVTFDFTAKIEHLLRQRALLPELRDLGCLFIVSAVESLSNRVLAILDKGHDRADVLAVTGLVREAGIALRPTFVAFTPWTTRADYLELFEFVDRQGLRDHVEPVQFTLRLLVPPGSLLLERAELTPHLGPLDAANFTYRWRHPDPAMDRLQTDAATLAREATAAGADPTTTFERLWDLAREDLGRGTLRAGRTGTHRPDTRRPTPDTRPPRLTEPWFC